MRHQWIVPLCKIHDWRNTRANFTSGEMPAHRGTCPGWRSTGWGCPLVHAGMHATLSLPAPGSDRPLLQHRCQPLSPIKTHTTLITPVAVEKGSQNLSDRHNHEVPISCPTKLHTATLEIQKHEISWKFPKTLWWVKSAPIFLSSYVMPQCKGNSIVSTVLVMTQVCW